MDSNRPFSPIFGEMLDLADNEYQKTLHELIFTTGGEYSDSSLHKDLEMKSKVYAEARIPEYLTWTKPLQKI